MEIMSALSTLRGGIAVTVTVLLAIVGPNAVRGQTSGTSSAKVADGTLVPAPGSPYTTDMLDSAVVTGDFNGDGLSDVVFSGGLDDTLTIFLASPKGGFVAAPGSPIFMRFFASALAVADYNRDGNLDIAALGPFDLEIFLGDGHGGFTPAAQYPVVSGSSNTHAIGFGAADFNRDGNIDLAYVNGIASVGTVNILLGDGTGNFTPAPGSVVSVGPYCQSTHHCELQQRWKSRRCSQSHNRQPSRDPVGRWNRPALCQPQWISHYRSGAHCHGPRRFQRRRKCGFGGR